MVSFVESAVSLERACDKNSDEKLKPESAKVKQGEEAVGENNLLCKYSYTSCCIIWVCTSFMVVCEELTFTSESVVAKGSLETFEGL